MKTIEDRYWAKVGRRGVGDCWPWTASIRPDGYGQIGIGGNKPEVAHRTGWRLANGPIPNGHDVDHMCHNDSDCLGGATCLHRRCQNPAHLRVVPRSVNVLAGKGICADNARKTHCDSGHEFTPSNTYNRKDGYRDCRTCKRIRQREYKARNRGRHVSPPPSATRR